ncbi:MAG: HAMP domain-containing sensor histidine kinase [Bryobacteraceae bacterium]
MNAGRRPGWSAAVVVVLAVCLVGFAWLQYRWIGQLSQAEEQRMQASLRLATSGFSREFDSGITHVYAALQGRRGPDRKSSGATQSADYAKRWMDWSASAADRNLVRNFYLAQTEPAGTLALERLNRDSGKFDPASWPPKFAKLRARLEAGHSRAGMLPHTIAEEIPAVIAPTWRFPSPDAPPPRPPRPGDGGFFRRPVITGWAIAELDREWIGKTLLPGLVDRNFAGSTGLDYQVAVVDGGDPRRLIYASDSRLPASYFAIADATTGLLRVRPELMAPRPEGMPAERPGVRPRRWREGGFPPPGRVDAAGWQLRVRHASGSLDAAVANARRRNLAISFASLLVLAATSAMLVVSTRRAQRLAELQIEFVAGVSHELRTPVSVICSAGDNLADGLIAEARHVRRYGAVIRQEGRRLAEMVDQILVFAAAQTGRVKYNPQPVAVAKIVDCAVDACGPELREGGWRIEKSVPSGLPAVMADPNALTDCLRNLIGNASKYGRSGLWIGIAAEVAAARRGTEIRIGVRDRGPGIASGDLPHIFEPFYRGRDAAAAQIRGAGLGLSLVRRSMEAQGGAVTVATSAEGSCFTLHLPIAPEPEAVASIIPVQSDAVAPD